jgi:plastocyanin
MRRAVVGCLSVLTGLGLFAQPAAADARSIAGRQGPKGSPVIVSAPGSRATTYATPLVVAQRGDNLTFVNTDVFVHAVRSVATGPDNTRWCKPADPNEPAHQTRNPRRFPIGKCPLLWTPPISMTNGYVETKVYGTRNLKPGTTVEFFCRVFPNMRGEVIVV